MANQGLFRSIVGKLLPKTDTVNSEKAPAYAFAPRQALAQYAATGCLNATFYADGAEQLDRVRALAGEVEPEFVAKTALYARQRGRMKDMPALLAATLAVRDGALLERVFDRVIDDGRQLRSFVQIVRSGEVGRKSLGSRPRRLVRRWLDARSDEQVLRASVGAKPSLADVIKMTHPKPHSASRSALYAWLIGKAHDAAALPEPVRAFEAWKSDPTRPVPEVPFLMLTAQELDDAAWTRIAERASWQTLRMNLNTFARHGVFAREGGSAMADAVARRLADRAEIVRAGVFPYQLLAAWASLDAAVPAVVKTALEAAMEVAIENVPAVAGRVVVCPDVSGSMSSPVTGHRKGATTAVRCIDVAALMAAALVRKNPGARVLPFEQWVVPIELDAEASVMANAAKLAAIGGGGTSCSAPIAELNRTRAAADLVVLVSDNESWVDTRGGRGTALLAEWQAFRARNPRARLVCIDIQPNATTQAPDREDLLNVGGFSDRVFDVVAEFAAGRLGRGHWVEVIEAVAV